MVIEDDDAVRQCISDNLRDCGYEVLEAVNGMNALVQIERNGDPDVIVADILMPKMGGLETIEKIKARKKCGIKIIAISGGGRTKAKNFLDEARDMGADDCFEKPLDLDKLEKRISSLLA